MEILSQYIIPFLAAAFGAWVGVKLAAKPAEKAQRELTQRLKETDQSLSAIARRLPGGEGYAAVKQQEYRIAQEQESKKKGA